MPAAGPALGSAFDRIVGALEAAGRQVKLTGPGKAQAQCPAHEDRHPSLSLRQTDGSALIYCHAGCVADAVLGALSLSKADLYDDRRGLTYRYDNGRLVHRKVDKSFAQSNTGAPPELYRLAKVKAAIAADQKVYVVEGEKDVHALEAEDVTATTAPMGASNWSKVDASPLFGGDIIVIGDQDDAGRLYVADVFASLDGMAKSVVVLAPKVGNDAADHIAAGYGVIDFVPVPHPAPPATAVLDEAIRPVLGEAALYGLPGRVVRDVEPHTEADPAAVLITFLAAVGVMLDRLAYLLAGDAEHPAKVWPLIIGRTAGGLKGTSWAAVRRIVLAADPLFADKIERGLSSGEGLIERVRDSDGMPDDKHFIEGVQDKRLLVVESEFAAVLGKAKREGNVLSETLRQAWDGDRLSTLTRKSSRLVATGAHICVIGHITPTELRAKLSESDVAGGLMNRFLPVHSQRSKRLPDGGCTPTVVIDRLGRELAAALALGRQQREIRRDAEADALWVTVYEKLTPELPDGHLASVIARAVPQVLRLCLVYALLDIDSSGQAVIRRVHLEAALAVWGYVEASARLTFGDLESNRDVSKIANAIDAAEHGLTRNDIGNLFDRHKPKTGLDELLRQLVVTGRYAERTVPTKGRPATRYQRTRPPAKTSKPSDGSNDDDDDDDEVISHNSLISLVTTTNVGAHAAIEIAHDPVVRDKREKRDKSTASITVPPVRERKKREKRDNSTSGTAVQPSARPLCRQCGEPNLFSPASIARGICERCTKIADSASTSAFDAV